MGTLIDINGLRKSYGENTVLKGVNLTVNRGEIIAIIGASGSGKSTLVRCIANLEQYQDGSITINGKKNSDYKSLNGILGMVFQNYNLIDYLTPLENVRLVNKNADRKILSELGLDEKQINRNVLQLSGGQQQRVAIARALVSEAPIILADEPTGNLDEETAKDIIAILKRMALDRQKCVIVVTHSKEVAQASDVVLELKKKQLIEKKK